MSFDPNTQPGYEMPDQDGQPPYQGPIPDQQQYEGQVPAQGQYEGYEGHVPEQQPITDTTPQYVNDLTHMMKLLTTNFEAFQNIMANYVQGQANTSAPAAATTASATTPVPRGTARVRDPRRFNGKIDEVEPFLNEIEDCVYIQRFALPTDEDKCRYMGLYMADGSPVEWFANIKRNHAHLLHDFTQFVVDFRTKFSDPNIQSTAMMKLDRLRQTGSAFQYTTKFHEICTHLKMTEETKIDRYKRGLKEAVKDALVPVFPRPTTMKAWEHLILAIDNNIFQRNNEKKHSANHHNSAVINPVHPPSTQPSSSTSTEVVPMDIDAVHTSTFRGKLTSEERQARMKANLCLYCGKPGHVVNDCFKRKAKHGDSKSGKATPKTT